MKTTTERVEQATLDVGDAFLGVEVSWSFGDGDGDAVQVSRTALRQAWTDEGFSAELVPDLEPQNALRRASTLVSTRGGIVIEAMPRKNKDTPIAFGIYKKVAIVGERGDEFHPGARVRVDPGGTIVCLPPEDGQGIPECMTVGEEMARIANQLADTAINLDLSHALVTAGRCIGWIPRRLIKGGTYFLLSGANCARYCRVLDRLEQLTEKEVLAKRFIPSVTEQYAKPRAMKAWCNAAAYVLEDELKTLVVDLDKVMSDGMRESTIDRKVKACTELLSKAEQYRVLLAGATDEIVVRIEKTRDEFKKAMGQLKGVAALEQVRALLHDDEETPDDEPAPVKPRKSKVRTPERPKGLAAFAAARKLLDDGA